MTERWCSTCGKTINTSSAAATYCASCAQWWADNPPPGPTGTLHARALVMAREIAAESLCRGETWLPGVKSGIHEEIIAGAHDSEPLVQSALAAILATTERAAEGMQSVNRMIGATESQKIALGYAEAKIRTGAHLKEPTS